MFLHRSHTSPGQSKRVPNKLIAAFAALIVTTVITAGGFAAAMSPSHKPTKQQCLAAGYTNYGQCVKDWAHHKNHPGHGYGGGNTSVATNINLNINNSNNNIIQVIVNIFR